MSAYHDLTNEEKEKLIVGSVLVGTFLLSFVVFVQLFLDRSQIDRLWASGASFFEVAKIIVPSMYLMFSLPISVSLSLTVAYLRRRFSALAIGFVTLFGMGAFFLIAYFLLFLFGILFATCHSHFKFFSYYLHSSYLGEYFLG